jgi:hypothetical protein
VGTLGDLAARVLGHGEKNVAMKSPPEIRQKPREQTRTNVNDLDRETLILLDFPDRVLRS